MRLATFSISELAKESGVSLRTLRFYEQIGILTPQRIGECRLYLERDRTRLDIVLKGKRHGLTLNEIKRLIDINAIERPEQLTQAFTLEELEIRISNYGRQAQQIDETLVNLRSMLEHMRKPA